MSSSLLVTEKVLINIVLTDPYITHPFLCRQLIICRITEKLLVEVRKVCPMIMLVISLIISFDCQEVNRLKVPVGQRLYKITGEEIPFATLGASVTGVH